MNTKLGKVISIATVVWIVSFFSAMAGENNWTHFRGSRLDGISSQSVPTIWNDSTNILWQVPVAGKGWSSPVIFDQQLWISTASHDGKKMSAVCLNTLSGAIIFDIELFYSDTIYSIHATNSYATPTPSIEEGFVYVHFGATGTACIDTKNGQLVWQRTDLKCEHVQGPGSSPIIYKNLLILHMEGTDVQYLVALDKKTGETVWQTYRPESIYEKLAPIGRKAYITPIIVNVNGHDLLISNGSAMCAAYNPETGEEIWRIVQGEDSSVSMPFSENGTVFFYTGFVTNSDDEKHAELLAVNPNGNGDLTQSNILWRFQSPILQLLTPVMKDGLIYTIDTRNVLYCIDAKTGAEIYSLKRRQKYNSSPVYANGYIYFTSVKGETLVLKAGKDLQIVAENKLPGQVYATPAIAQHSIFIRTDSHLYCIGQK
ncbi:MAG: PQQ-binding-like beta-propeller repeat protein [Prolixibacteraceae bacterium]|nr:PQQ-binding-like beta-propeller repeat protein [Prolixibacteraceae bacterium]